MPSVGHPNETLNNIIWKLFVLVEITLYFLGSMKIENKHLLVIKKHPFILK
jgi:hypothetical protein